MDYKGLWQAVLGELEVSVSPLNFSTWFKNTYIISSQDGHVVIGVPNIFTKKWLEEKYHGEIKSVLAKIDSSITSIECKVKAALEHREEPAPQQPGQPQAAAEPIVSESSFSLNDRYNFEAFIVGSSNELAYAACQAVVKNPGLKYNPLFIYGGVGLGKTHLMQAVGNEIIKRDSAKKIEYITSESFTNQFVTSISRKKTAGFAEKYRGVDVLIVDDMQFLAGKEKTQDEFFHTFNALHQANKQIILSSDQPPKAIRGLDERLLSRFEMGMTADIQPPDLETRAAILQNKAARQGMTLPMETIDYLAQQFQSNIRELEGALTRLAAHCELRGLVPNAAIARELINQGGLRSRLKTTTAKLVIEKTAQYFDLLTTELIGPKRDKEILLPRQIAMYLMRQELSLSFPKIAAATGGRDHTTAMHSVSKIGRQLELDQNLRAEVSAIKQSLSS